MAANQEIDSISLGLKGDASSLLTACTKGANAVVKFQKTVTTESEKLTTSLDTMFAGSAKAVSLLHTPLSELSPEIRTLSSIIKQLGASFKGADTDIANTGKTTRKTKEDIENSAAAVNRLTREYKAGKLSVVEYTSALAEMAKTAQNGSEKQLAALTKLREMKVRVQQADQKIALEAERLVDKEVLGLAKRTTAELEAIEKRVAAEKKAAQEIAAAKAKADAKQNKGEAQIAHGLGAAGTAMSLGVTAPVVIGGWDALKSASSLRESQSKTQVVFKENEKEMLAWAKTADTAFAMSERAALDQAATVGNSFNEMGLGSAKAAEMSRRLVELAGDWASIRFFVRCRLLRRRQVWQSPSGGKFGDCHIAFTRITKAAGNAQILGSVSPAF